MKFAERIHAPSGMKPSLTNVCLSVNLTQLGSPLFCSVQLFSIVLCDAAFRLSPSFFAAGWRGEAPEQTNSKRLFVPQRQKTHLHSFLPLSVYLLHTPQCEHESFPCLQLSTMLHLCAPAHTPEYHCRGAVNFFLYLDHSLSRNTQSPLSHSSFLYLSLPHQPSLVSLSLNLHPFSPSISQIGDLTQHPRYNDFIQAAAAVKATEQSVGGGEINTAAVSGAPG